MSCRGERLTYSPSYPSIAKGETFKSTRHLYRKDLSHRCLSLGLLFSSGLVEEHGLSVHQFLIVFTCQKNSGGMIPVLCLF